MPRKRREFDRLPGRADRYVRFRCLEVRERELPRSGEITLERVRARYADPRKGDLNDFWRERGEIQAASVNPDEWATRLGTALQPGDALPMAIWCKRQATILPHRAGRV